MMHFHINADKPISTAKRYELIEIENITWDDSSIEKRNSNNYKSLFKDNMLIWKYS